MTLIEFQSDMQLHLTGRPPDELGILWTEHISLKKHERKIPTLEHIHSFYTDALRVTRMNIVYITSKHEFLKLKSQNNRTWDFFCTADRKAYAQVLNFDMTILKVMVSLVLQSCLTS